MTHEMGKVQAEAGGDVQEAIDMSYYMGGEGRRLFGQTTPSELRDKFQMSVRMPIGVVGVITPWNFPIAIPSWKIAPALVCGDTSSSSRRRDTPAARPSLRRDPRRGGRPEGRRQHRPRRRWRRSGDALVRHPDVPVITFTGSRDTGVEVLKTAADHLKHVHLELGGKNAIIVMDDADLDLAVDGILWSAFGTSGQRCTAASRVIVARERLRRRCEAPRRARGGAALGVGWEDDTDVGPVINRAALEKVHSYTQVGIDDGAKLLTGGEIASDGDLAKGFYYRPTIFGDVEPDMRIAQEEIFGPTTLADQGARRGRGDAGLERDPLRALVVDLHARRQSRVPRACAICRRGSRTSTRARSGAEVHLPFGGTKETGNGHREAGQAALDVFTEWKSVYVDYSGTLQRAQIDNLE